jgi:hypothetical protein
MEHRLPIIDSELRELVPRIGVQIFGGFEGRHGGLSRYTRVNNQQ